MEVHRVNGTRDRLVTVGAALFQRQGFTGTGIKQILSEANAPFSSLYHHFPGGKEELAVEAVRLSGAEYQHLVEAVWDGSPDPVSSVAAVFAGAAETLQATGFAVACPIGTVALEAASTNESLRVVTAEVFEAWVTAGAVRLEAQGLSAEDARSLALSVIALLEGAFMLCQAARSTEAMAAAGACAVAATEAALDAGRRAEPPIVGQ